MLTRRAVIRTLYSSAGSAVGPTLYWLFHCSPFDSGMERSIAEIRVLPLSLRPERWDLESDVILYLSSLPRSILLVNYSWKWVLAADSGAMGLWWDPEKLEHVTSKLICHKIHASHVGYGVTANIAASHRFRGSSGFDSPYPNASMPFLCPFFVYKFEVEDGNNCATREREYGCGHTTTLNWWVRGLSTQQHWSLCGGFQVPSLRCTMSALE